VEVWLHTFLNSALCEDYWLASHPDWFNSDETVPDKSYVERLLGNIAGLVMVWKGKDSDIAGIRTPVLQPKGL